MRSDVGGGCAGFTMMTGQRYMHTVRPLGWCWAIGESIPIDRMQAQIMGQLVKDSTRGACLPVRWALRLETVDANPAAGGIYRNRSWPAGQ